MISLLDSMKNLSIPDKAPNIKKNGVISKISIFINNALGSPLISINANRIVGIIVGIISGIAFYIGLKPFNYNPTIWKVYIPIAIVHTTFVIITSKGCPKTPNICPNPKITDDTIIAIIVLFLFL